MERPSHAFAMKVFTHGSNGVSILSVERDVIGPSSTTCSPRAAG